MWMPKTEEQINTVVSSGSLEEGATFDAKKAMPTNKETAKDLAAMATDGGVIIYGIAEDESGRPTVLAPIPLVGQREHIESIARTAIQEPVSIKSWAIPTEADPSVGYIVVVVPPSERAPHMVTVKGTNRYYGRRGTQNAPLTEGEVARLYERRQRWEVDRNAMLDGVVENAPLAPHPVFGYLHLIARPVLRDESFLEGIVTDESSIDTVLSGLINRALAADVFPKDRFAPDFNSPYDWLRRVEGYRGQLGDRDPEVDDPNSVRNTLTVQFYHDGSFYLFCGRATDVRERPLLLAQLVTGLTVRALVTLAELYKKGQYSGMVDLGIALTNIEGALPLVPNRGIMQFATYDRPDYRKTCRVSAMTMTADRISITRRLLDPLFRATLQDMYDPILQVPKVKSGS